jgi:HK97 family phage prohead protease
MTQQLQYHQPAEFKVASEGSFEGYAAVFGNVDSGGDVIAPGAFKQFERTRDGKTLVLLQHDATNPIGKAEVAQDSRGLHVRGRLLMTEATAAATYERMKGGLLDGMSIGYSVLSGGASYKADHRELTALKLFEVSIVTWPMNTEARVETVKSALDCADVRELEHLLREVPQLQFSSRKAKAAANLLWPLVAGREAQDDACDERAEKALLEITSTLANLNHTLKGILK